MGFLTLMAVSSIFSSIFQGLYSPLRYERSCERSKGELPSVNSSVMTHLERTERNTVRISDHLTVLAAPVRDQLREVKGRVAFSEQLCDHTPREYREKYCKNLRPPYCTRRSGTRAAVRGQMASCLQ